MAEENTAETLDDEPDSGDAQADDSAAEATSADAAAEASAADTASSEPAGADVTPQDTVTSPRGVSQTPDSGAASAARPAARDGAGADISLIMDIPVTLSMEIGRTRLTINELLQLGQGSVVELQRMADEPMDVLVNGTLVAHGEAVVVGDRFGIRLTDVISPQERLSKLT